MDKRIRRNEICIIGLPRCDYVFSSTRSCFIAYGFAASTLEMAILRHLLEQRGIEPVEAGGSLAPAQSAFCAKICSKIITSQFCIVLLNNDEQGGHEVPNANVNMEYGLMLGFNKYVIPFQRAEQKLPFNVAGLDTIKYTQRDFERLAANAIDQAIETTSQERRPIQPDQNLEAFLLIRKALITRLNNEGDQTLYDIGSPLGFNLLGDFSGFRYFYLGNFTTLRPEAILWRLRMLTEILDDRMSTIEERVRLGVVTAELASFVDGLLRSAEAWIVVNTEDDKNALVMALGENPLNRPTKIWSLEDVRRELAGSDFQ